jgi:YVTN family beta-propeller protein
MARRPTLWSTLLPSFPTAFLALAAAANAAPFSYVSISDSASVAVIDTASGAEVRRIPLEGAGRAFAVDPSGERVYVNAQDGVAEIDARTNTLARVIHLGIEPAGVAVSPGGDRVYVVDYARDGSVKVLDAGKGAVLATIGVGNYPSAIASVRTD